MLIIKTIAEMRQFVSEARKNNRSVGLVPTMGYFHRGHLALMEKAVQQCDVVVTSLYVNPLQFGPAEDFAAYPKDLERDAKLAESVGVDVIFAPTDREMYPAGFDTTVSVGDTITGKLCGLSRPGHFTGVATVVTKLFNIVQPDKAFFGQKDAQQVLVIKRMVQDLNMNVEIVPVPIVREKDGLAMSSRNVYLTPEQRQAATVLYKSLQLAQEQVKKGQRDGAEICRLVKEKINSEPLAELDYVEIYSYPELKSIDKINGAALLAVAAKFGLARLIDNIILEA
ncbi:pantoate--beta-alanine ligase [Desulfohalotomaculum tongense]|uniref:pantoate--beta-alanine ligase n=1 Tax=Desulforadius tongensis TaxID=1216062 RepID=UPI00195B9646|nr:pantoate--beta-alanine ligase [Desulforadius tongensis]MBM7856034.1 pantoate--beta-alanine ligase [Desulforadius tongensis]